MINWIKAASGFNFQSLVPTMEQMHINETIESERHGRLWFGYFGVSGYVLDINSVECFMLILLLLVKFTIIKIFVRNAPKIVK